MSFGTPKKPSEPKPFVEYPKWVTAADGKDVIVQNGEEELAVTAPRKKLGLPKKGNGQ